MLTTDEIKFLKTIPKSKKVRIIPYNSKVEGIVKDIIRKINKAIPKLEVKHIGAQALKISGQKDIDIYVLCPQKDFQKYLPILMKLFDLPKSMSKTSIEWNFHKMGYEIELYLTDPTTESMQRQLKVFEILKSDKKLLKEYEALKESFRGKSYHDYQKAKYKFYNRILK